MRRGDVVRLGFDPIQGSEQGGERPAVVVSPDLINQYSPVILVAPITSKKTERVYPFEVLIEPPDGGLRLRSKASLIQLRAIDKSRVTGTLGTVTVATLSRLESALRIATGLDPL